MKAMCTISNNNNLELDKIYTVVEDNERPCSGIGFCSEDAMKKCTKGFYNIISFTSGSYFSCRFFVLEDL